MSTLSKPYTFTAGTYAVASQVNANLDTIYSWINSNAIWADASIAFTGVPVGPNTDPTTGNQLTRKSYVDAQVAATLSSATPKGTFGYNGSATGARPILVNGARTYVSTDTSGNFTINYDVAFPNATIMVVACMGSTGSGDIMVQTSDTNGRSNSFFTGRIVNASTGTGLHTPSMAVEWVALGY